MQDGALVRTVDHYVKVLSTAPSMKGQAAQLYVRERAQAEAGAVVLFVHGIGLPSEVGFDAPSDDYSWMAHLAAAGFDVFAMDITGYGRSTRPYPMNDPCNLTPSQQTGLVETSCPPANVSALNTIASEWHDIDTVVDYLRGLRHVERVVLAGWSLGGPRVAGYADRHAEKIDKLILIAPAYYRRNSDGPAATGNAPFNIQSRQEFTTNWLDQVGCKDQIGPALPDSIWPHVLASDPVGATWANGVRRAPSTAFVLDDGQTPWRWNKEIAARSRIPTLMISGEHDKQVAPASVHELYDDWGAKQKLLVDVACASHFPMWEKNRQLLFRASADWLQSGAIQGVRDGVVRIGDR